MKINHIGHTSCGQRHTVENLITALSLAALDPTFEEYGNFFYHPENDDNRHVPANVRHASGNFCHLSFGFSIDGTRSELRKLEIAIRQNQQTEMYRRCKEVAALREEVEGLAQEQHRKRDGFFDYKSWPRWEEFRAKQKTSEAENLAAIQRIPFEL